LDPLSFSPPRIIEYSEEAMLCVWWMGDGMRGER